MSRAVAEALVLVNWKGVFYERYALHRHVTALEGDNGAGKTTVMIAAYVVLLPDMSLLRFTNLGESSATGGDKGVWGRLGSSSRPAYAALDLRLPGGERIVAGVRLERRAEPSVDLSPFVIRELGWDVQLQDVLLERGEVDAVPDLGQLRQLVARSAGRLVTFDAAKDYFAELFDLGVLPLRLATDSERTKLNEMLRTSMVGGISRALTGGLREFLLKEDSGLADTLKHMRTNLEECRRTRQQVTESARLESEIREVFEAGHRLFAAGLHGDRERADELGRAANEAREALREANANLETLTRQLDAARTEALEAAEARERARVELTTARDARDRLRQALALTRRARGLEASLLQRVQEEAEARASLARAERALEQERARRDAARAAREVATDGLAEHQKGFETLQVRAGRHNHVTGRLRDAVRLLGEPEIAPERLDEHIDALQAQLDVLDDRLAAADQALGTARAREARFQAALATLQRVTGQPAAPDEAWARARDALHELRELDALAERRDALGEELAAARKNERLQAEARAEARRLSTLERPLSTAAAVQRAADEADDVESRLATEAETARATLATLERDLEAADARLAASAEAQRLWSDAREAARRISTSLGQPVETRADLEGALTERIERQTLLSRALDEQDAARQQRDAEIERLRQMGGHVDPPLLAARDLVDGELLAGRFEDVSPEEAAEMEARLGPLASAILVEDMDGATRRLAEARGVPETVWLVGPGAIPTVDGAPDRIGSSVLVREQSAWRLTRPSKRPVLGRRAREQRIESLRAELRQIDQARDAARRAVQDNEAIVRGLRALAPRAHLLDSPDPSLEAQEIGLRRASLTLEHTARAADLERTRRAHAEARARRRALASLRDTAWLLDQPDLPTRVAELSAQIEAAQRARQRLDQVRTDRAALSSQVEELRALPLGQAALEALGQEVDRLSAERERLSRARAALVEVAADRIALAWTDAPRLLQDGVRLEPTLKEQLRLAREREQEADAAFGQAERALTDARGQAVSATARREVEAEALQTAREELAELGLGEVDEAALDRAERRVEDAEAAELSAEQRQQGAARALAVLEDRTKSTAAERDTRSRNLETAESTWRPAQIRWERLRRAAEEKGVLAPLLTDWSDWEGRGSLNLWSQVQTQRTLLLDRLERAEGGRELIAELPRPTSRDSDQGPGEIALETWLCVRAWIRRRVPAAIAEVEDPLEALSRLRAWLERLRETLERKEHELRGRSSDVARNIETLVRRARRHVDQLNRDLERVRFGSVRGVQIRVRNVERMSAVLRALQDGTAQELLFQSRMTIEDALDALFQRVGGGRSGGHKLLDYREYLSLEVEVRRQSSPDWELANPTRLSTGEAIGVGAAVMMVVLTAWERDANLLRTHRSAGTLRLLFLDEANRLSQDNLGILFELCKNLELQLLIAAPEVATAQGNTTYRLVRQVDEDGQEVVVVTGRRVVEAR